MIDLERERELFEQSIPETDFHAKAVIRENNYYIKDPKPRLRKRDHENAIVRVNSGWNAWLKRAELAQAQQQAIESLKAQLAQYQSDDYVLVPKVPSEVIKNQINEVIAESIYVETSWGGVNTAQFECGTDEVVYKAMIEVQEENDV